MGLFIRVVAVFFVLLYKSQFAGRGLKVPKLRNQKNNKKWWHLSYRSTRHLYRSVRPGRIGAAEMAVNMSCHLKTQRVHIKVITAVA